MGDCRFRMDDLVQVIRDREPAVFRGVVIPANGTEPFAKLQPFTGGGLRFVRISQIEAYDPLDGRTVADRVEMIARQALQWGVGE